jgi:hypothetical protein
MPNREVVIFSPPWEGNRKRLNWSELGRGGLFRFSFSKSHPGLRPPPTLRSESETLPGGENVSDDGLHSEIIVVDD